MRLPDPERSYAVFVGTSKYRSGSLAELPGVRNNLTDLVRALTDPLTGGFLSKNCTVLTEPARADAVLRGVYQAADRAEDTLLVYYAGHGLAGERSTELFLALSDTDPTSPLWWVNALPYDGIRRVLLDCRAANRIVILDCCYSGRAVVDVQGADLTGMVDIRGTYTLAAVAGNRLAHAPAAGRHTAFTGELIQLLRHGIPDGPPLLTLTTLFPHLRKRLAEGGLNPPRQSNSDTIAELALARNAARRTGTGITAVAGVGALGRGRRRRAAPKLRLPRRTLIGIYAVVATLAVAVALIGAFAHPTIGGDLGSLLPGREGTATSPPAHSPSPPASGSAGTASAPAGSASAGQLVIVHPPEGRPVQDWEAVEIPMAPPAGYALLVMVRARPLSEADSVWYVVSCRLNELKLGQSVCKGVAFGGGGSQSGRWDLVALLATQAQASTLLRLPNKEYRGRLDALEVVTRSRIYGYGR